MRRCLRSKNECGTDTWSTGYTCPCDECQAYLREAMTLAPDRMLPESIRVALAKSEGK